jgi:regulator of PEP synthase PpsR (kinase-PPPase family)
LFEVTENAKGQDQHLSKKMKVLETDILSEKILLEKARMEEVEETIRVQRAGELRNSLQKELEDVEQKDTIVKFELFELKKVHDELQRSLTNMKKQNSQMVEPVLERLKKEVKKFIFYVSFCFLSLQLLLRLLN